MYQQQVPQPRDEQSWSSSGTNYEEGYGGNLQQSDQLADAIARRLQSQSPMNMQIPSVQFSRGGVSAGMRLALAIVSVGVLIPITGIIVGVLGPSFGALVGLSIACAAILGINFTFAFHR